MDIEKTILGEFNPLKLKESDEEKPIDDNSGKEDK